LVGSAAVPPGESALLVVATNLVYFSTHVFAYSIGDPNVEGKHLPQVAAHHARVAAPMVSTAFLPSSLCWCWRSWARITTRPPVMTTALVLAKLWLKH
jgi:hypothetical protein